MTNICKICGKLNHDKRTYWHKTWLCSDDCQKVNDDDMQLKRQRDGIWYQNFKDLYYDLDGDDVVKCETIMKVWKWMDKSRGFGDQNVARLIEKSALLYLRENHPREFLLLKL